MAGVLGPRVLDVGLSALDAECDKIYVCSAEPTTYSQATTAGTYALGNKSFTQGTVFGSPGAGSPDGRASVSVAVTDGSITNSGTISHWAAVDSTTSRLLARGPVTGGIAVTGGQVFTLGAVTVTMSGAGAGSAGYVGLGDIVAGLSFWGLRGYNAAYSTGSNPCIDLYNASAVLVGTVNILADGSLDVATAATLIAAGGTRIGRLYDQVGTVHLIQSTFANMPTLTLSAINSKPGMTFSGSQVLIAPTSGITTAQPYSCSLVAKGTGTVMESIFGSSDGVNWPMGAHPSGALNQWFAHAGVIVPAAASDATFHTGLGLYNGATSNLCIDGGADNISDGGTGALDAGTGLVLGAQADLNYAFTGVILETMVWNSNVMSNKSTLNSNQTTYWGPF